MILVALHLELTDIFNCRFFLNRFLVCFNLFVVLFLKTPWLVVAVQPCMEWIPIKKIYIIINIGPRIDFMHTGIFISCTSGHYQPVQALVYWRKFVLNILSLLDWKDTYKLFSYFVFCSILSLKVAGSFRTGAVTPPPPSNQVQYLSPWNLELHTSLGSNQ